MRGKPARIGEFQVAFTCTVRNLYFVSFGFYLGGFIVVACLFVFAKPDFSSQLSFLVIFSCLMNYPTFFLQYHFHTSFSYTNQKQAKWERNRSTGMRSVAVNVE